MDGYLKILVRYLQHLVHLSAGGNGLFFIFQIMIFLVLGTESDILLTSRTFIQDTLSSV